MVKVTVIGAKVVLVNVPAILPVPLAAIPVTVTVLFLVQLYTVPTTLPVSAIVVIAEPEQIVWLDGVATAFGIGFTMIVAVIGVPGQPLATGVIVKVTVTAALVKLVNAAAGTLPAPLAGRPVTVALLSLTQLYTVPATAPVNTIGRVVDPVQIVCVVGVAVAFGVGFTNTVAVIGAPLQPLAAGVMVNVTVIGILVVFVSVPLILPAPLAAIPVTVATLSLVQL
jgi:hypothetical protein